jgi:hypothetical protein
MQLISLILNITLLLQSTLAKTRSTKPNDAVLLSQVRSLTLHDGKKTSHRRVSAVPQLLCVGGNAEGLYDVDVMRCKNAGSEYDAEDIQWTCQASMPAEFKLGSTEVFCEGYDSPDDPYILKGSCGVEYRLILTEQGEQKYGRRQDGAFRSGKVFGSSGYANTLMGAIWKVFFWAVFICKSR